MAGVILENVSRVFPGGAVAVDRVSLEVQDREFLVLLGPSGCGKTTTLRLIAGLEEPSGGTIKIGSRIVNDVPPKQRDIAMVFQNYALYPHMSVYRNMAFGLELREGLASWGWSSWGWLWRWALPARRRADLAARRFAIAERVHDAARAPGIDDLLERMPRQLSGGQRQRVALGRAMVRNPAVFLFDEPLSNLDAKLRVETRRELKQLHERLAATMIYVTHDQVEALTLGQRIVVMHEGKVQQVGPPIEVYDWPANRFVAGFIGTPAMNFIAGELTDNRTDEVRYKDTHTDAKQRGARFRRGAWSVSLAKRSLAKPLTAGGRGEPAAALLGVRPEHVTLKASATPAGLPALVETTEELGDTTIVTTRLDREEIYATHQDSATYVVSKSDNRAAFRPQDRVWVEVDENRLHVFDPATGENLVQRPS